jgi:hypothetical protein
MLSSFIIGVTFDFAGREQLFGYRNPVAWLADLEGFN